MSQAVQSGAGLPSTSPAATESRRSLWGIIGASSAGTLIEWYDFYIFASLATVVAGQFFPEGNELLGFLKTLATIWIGFAVRPFGSIFFGYLGDIIGRKYTFLVTLLLMGGATFAIGLMPTYTQLEQSIGMGWIAPALLLVLRVLQGLALGGEYGGAATYIAEHCPDGQRGFWTSFIQTTATLGLFVSLGVILITKFSMPKEDFNSWGWRVPFLLSIILVVFSYILRLRMKESPVFQRMKSAGKGARNPIRESFGNWYNLKYVLLALFGATAGQGVVWYTGQFYALFFLQKTLHIELAQSTIIVGVALLLATPFFVIMGSLSDKIGRMPIIMAGCFLAVVTYVPIFHGISFQGDLRKKTLAENGVVSQGDLKIDHLTKDEPRVGGTVGDTVTTEHLERTYTDGTTAMETRRAYFKPGVNDAYHTESAIADVRLGMGPAILTVALIGVLVTYVALVYGPIAAFLVELFPTRIRYTSMSLPYHVGNGVFGGLVPFAATWLAASSLAAENSPLTKLVGGPQYVGLIYPISIALLTLIVGLALVRERKNVKIAGEDHV